MGNKLRILHFGSCPLVITAIFAPDYSWPVKERQALLARISCAHGDARVCKSSSFVEFKGSASCGQPSAFHCRGRTAKDGSGIIGYKDTLILPWCGTSGTTTHAGRTILP